MPASTHRRRRRSSDLADDYEPRPQRRRRLRRSGGGWHRWLIGLAVLLVLAWIAPMIVAHTPLRNQVLSAALSGLNGEVSAGSASFGWFSPVVLRDVEIRDRRGDAVLSAEEIHVDRSLRQLITGRDELGRIRVKRPQLTAKVFEHGSNVEDVFAHWLEPSQEPSLNCPAVGVDLLDGSVMVEDFVTRQRRQLQGLNLKLDLARDWSAPLELTADARVDQPNGRGEVKAKLTMTRARKPDGTLGSRGKADVQTGGFYLELLQPLMRRLAPATSVSGWVAGDAQYQWGVSGDNAPQAVIAANLSGQDLVVDSPALGRDTLRLESWRLPCRLVYDDGFLTVSEMSTHCDLGQIDLQGTPTIDVRRGFTGLVEALRRESYQVKGRVDLARLAELLPGTLRIRQGTRVTSGQLDVQMSREGEREGAVWKGRLFTTQLQAVNGNRPITWNKPVTVDFSARETAEGVVLDALNCQSDFITLEAGGSPNYFSVVAEYDLDRLAYQLDQFLDLGGLKMAGGGWSYLEFKRRADGDFTADFQSQLQALEVAAPQGGAWMEKRLTMVATVSGKFLNEELRRIDSATLEVKSGADRLDARITQPVELASYRRPGSTSISVNYPPDEPAPYGPAAAIPPDSLDDNPAARIRPPLGPTPHRPSGTPPAQAIAHADADWPIEIDLRGDMDRWKARLEPFIGSLGDVKIHGECQLLANAVASADAIVVNNSQMMIQDMRGTAGGWYIDEPNVVVNLTGRFYPQRQLAEIQSARLTGKSVALQTGAATINYARRDMPQITGDVDYSIDLAKIQQFSRGRLQHGPAAPGGLASDPRRDPPTYQLAGHAVGRLRFSRNGADLTGQIDGSIKNLTIRSPQSGELWREDEVRLAGSGRFDPRQDSLTIHRIQVNSNKLRCDARGQISQYSGSKTFDLRGELEYDLRELMALLKPYTREEIQVYAQRAPHPFFIQGNLSPPAAVLRGTVDPRFGSPSPPAASSRCDVLYGRIAAGTGIDWTGASVYGFRFGAGGLRAELRDGVIKFEPVDLSVNDGRLLANAKIDLCAGLGPELLLTEGPLLERVQITPEMCNAGLKYALPMLYRVTEAQGKFSIFIQGCNIPLANPVHGERAGHFTIHDIRVSPGPTLQLVAQAIDLARATSGKSAKAASQLRVISLKRESKVQYRMVDGKVYHRNLELDFDGTTVKTEGSVGLDQSINLVAHITSRKLGPQPISLPITGTLDHPRLDRSKIPAALGRMLINEDTLKSPAVDKLRESIEKNTKDLFKKFGPGKLDDLFKPPR